MVLNKQQVLNSLISKLKKNGFQKTFGSAKKTAKILKDEYGLNTHAPSDYIIILNK